MSESKPKKNIFILGLVSLFTDLSSQMVYPLVPEFLISIGASKAIIGMIEGVAESTASLFRTIFGRLSDKLKKRKLFIFLGYGLSALSKPFLYLANVWTVVLGVRFSDRMGKAIRTPARDALISTSVDPSEKGKAFGLHRAMDRIGAIGGPILAMLVLSLFSDNVRLVFLLSVIPGILALFFVRFAKETSIEQHGDVPIKRNSLRNASFIIFLVSNIIFTLGNSSNAFLILRAREAGLTIIMIPVIWVVYNISCTISSPIFGSLSDRIGRKPIIITSFLFYSFVYFLFGITKNLLMIWVLFAAYGIYYGLSAGVFRAYIADLVEPKNRATAYGIFNTGIGLALLPASLIMGALWDSYGSKWAFMTSAGFSLLGFTVFIVSLFLRSGHRKIKYQF
ncbi:MAG: MFS transporter [bacterium]